MPDKQRRRLLALSLGLFLFSIYLLIYRGGFHSVDEVSMFAVTESIAKFGRFNTDQIAWTQWTTSQAEAQGFFGQDGHVYSKKGLALSLAQVPLYWLALYLPGLGMLQTVSLLNAAITALTALVLFMFVWRLGYSTITAVILALLYGLATISFVYAKYLFSEPLAGFLLLLAAYMLFTYRQEAGIRHLVIAGLAAGFAVLTRANNLFLLPVFGLYVLWIEYQHHPNARLQERIKQGFGPVISFIIALLIPGAMILFYNAIRAGDALQTGYDLTLFSSNPWLGLYKLLFSPLRGLFIYSPILLLSLPGWFLFRRKYAAEAWLFFSLIAITLGLFAFWSSGEGLSWGSRFLVPLIPFFVIPLAPLTENLRTTHYTLHIFFFILLSLSLIIQLLGVTINPWIFLAQLQADFGGEFFLENTDALYDFRYSQIFGQIQHWSLENSDLAWLRWGFDPIAFGLSFGLTLFTGWLLLRAFSSRPTNTLNRLLYSAIIVTLFITYGLLVRYNQIDLQFGQPGDAYTQALNQVSTQAAADDQILTVAQYHYHVPMNRYKQTKPIIGFAQQSWPLPETALPLLETATTSSNIWLITHGFPPAAPDNAAERWLTENSYKASEEWLDDSVRLVRFATAESLTTRPIEATLGDMFRLREVNLAKQTVAGGSLPIGLVWQLLTTSKTNYNIFLQLINVEGALIAQHDNPLNGGYQPTSTWGLDEAFIARHALPIPADLPSGDYRLIAGLYDPATGIRLPVDTGGDFVELGNITIIAQE